MYGGRCLWAKYAGMRFVFLVVHWGSFWRARRSRRRHRVNMWWGESTGVINEIWSHRLPPSIKSAILEAGYDAVASLHVLIIAFNKYFNRSSIIRSPIIQPYDYANSCVLVFHCLCIDEQKATNYAKRMNGVIDSVIVCPHPRVACFWIDLVKLQVEL